MAKSYSLIIEDDDGETTLVPFEAIDITVGRWDGNAIRLLDRNVSRRHARFSRVNGSVFLEDLNSFNGVKLNGERIDTRTEINEGDLVEIGDYHLALQLAKANKASETVADERIPTVMANAPAASPSAPLSHLETVTQANSPQSHSTTDDSGNHPFVSPPPTKERQSNPVLPPFPAAGGLSAPENPFFDPQSSNMLADEHASRTEQISVGPSAIANIPRIICVSTEYAGTAFSLQNAEVIIGRVEDNDIVIEHRSVSRNHAKILFDGQVHKIIDLDSANGILVNGEEYAITDLRHGDLIELGHVNFRFVMSNEPFVPAEEEVKAMIDAGVSPPENPVESAPATIPESESEGEAIASTLPPNREMQRIPEPAPAQDLSDAKTVTDTPLDALAVSEMFEPNVSTRKSEKFDSERASIHQSKTETDVGSPPSSLTQSKDPWGTETKPALEKPTTSSAAGPKEALSSRNVPTMPSQPQYQWDQDDDYYPQKSMTGRVVTGLVVVALIGLLFSFFGSSSVDHDAALAKLFEEQKYAQVYSYYLENSSSFKYKEKAFKLSAEASQKVKEKSTPKSSPEPKEEKSLEPEKTSVEASPEVVEKTVEPETAAAEPVVEDEAKATKTAKKKTKKANRRKQRQARKKKRTETTRSERQKAEMYYRRGNELLAFDRKNAEHWLVLCIKTAPKFADCHRSLGILFAEVNPDKAIYHYRKYVQLKPSADDAATVREFIRQATGK
ncbi:MAG: FHA domain-containing protein [Myxococcota bacterium]|nr:FHA domain-containing protein [Myxococcota bacterium]